MQLKYNNYTHHNSQSNTTKYQLSTEARKSSTTPQPHRNDVLAYINLLDKCTQILREDRIWIRNQLKANDNQIISIFKQARKPVNLQHLQIKLRKHVTAFKSKAKMEQLMKFKQNMHLGEYKHEKVVNVKKASSNNQNPHKYQINQSSSLSRSNGYKMNSSQNRLGLQNIQNHSIESHTKIDKKPMIYPYRNYQNNQKQSNYSKEKKTYNNSGNNTHKNNMNNDYPVPMEEITERQSQNMTSARHRLHDQINFNNTTTNQGFNFGVPFNYTQWKRPDTTNPINKETNKFKDPLEEIRAQFNKVGITSAHSNLSEQIKGLKNNFLLDQESYSNEKKYEEKTQRFSVQNKREESQTNSRHNSIKREEQSYDKPQFSSYHEPENYKKQLSASPNKYQNQGEFLQNNHNHTSSLHSYQSNTSSEKNASYHEKQQSEETNLMQNAPFTYTIPSSSAKSNHKTTQNDNLFTSPELLAECRNFLKSKSSGKNGQSNFAKFDMEESLKPLNLRFDEKNQKVDNLFSLSENVDQKMNIDTFPNNYQPSMKYPQESKQQSFMNYRNDSSSQNMLMNDHSKDNYEYFHTFAAQSSQKKPENNNIQLNLRPETKVNLNLHNIEQNYPDYGRNKFDDHHEQPEYDPYPQEQEQQEGTYLNKPNQINYRQAGECESGTAQLFTAQYFVSFVLDLVTKEPKGFIYWNTLEKAVMEQCPELIDAARDYLYNEEGLVMISNIGRVLDDLLESNPVENDVRNIYKLLDIEQKGFIYAKDIQDFLSQLQESQAQDVETIAQYLWTLFEQIDEGIEEGEQKKIDYWGLYASHTDPNFENLNEILKQFDFQIE